MSAERREQEPLLDHESGADAAPQAPLTKWTRHSLRVFLQVLFITAMSGVTSSLFPPAASEMIEISICRTRYPDVTDTRKDERCKNNHVQTELAVVLAGSIMAQMIAGILAAIPFGMLADRIGRRPVFLIVSLSVLIDYSAVMTVCKFF